MWLTFSFPWALLGVAAKSPLLRSRSGVANAPERVHESLMRDVILRGRL